VKKWPAVAALWLWIAILFAAHFGARSPYSYGWAIFRGTSVRMFGAVVNPDARVVQPVTLYFYDAATPENWGNSPNFRLPFHSFLVATAASFTRSSLASYELVNLGALTLLCVVAINFAIRRGLRLLPVTVALMTMAALPWLATYAAQPMHYVAGTAINFLCVIAAMALPDDDLRKPWLSGLLLAIVMLNYDAYIFAAALALYVMLFVRFRRARDYAVFIVVAAAPVVLWTQFLRLLTHDTLSRMIERTFIRPVAHAWLEFFRSPLVYALRPFIAPHVGLQIGGRVVMAMVYWPVLLVCIAGAWRVRQRAAPLVALLLAIFVLHQMGTAAFDWENNPRRALPVVLAIAIVYCWLADRLWPERRWRVAFIAALAISCTLAMADTIFHTPAIQYLATGQAMQMHPKDAITFGYMRFDNGTMPTLMHDEPLVWHDLPRAHVAAEAAAKWAFAQVFNALFVGALFWLLARAQLLPRWAPALAAAVWIASAVRFLG
jgi:hypothetical protein